MTKKTQSLMIHSASLSRPLWWRAKSFPLKSNREKENDKFEQPAGSCSEDAGQRRNHCGIVSNDL
jgi:hypothetical protein